MKPCDQVVDALSEGKDLDAALQAHAALCDDCRSVLAADRALGALTAVEASDEAPLPPALRAALARDTRPVRPFAPWRRALPTVVAAVAVAGAVLLAMPRADLAHQAPSRIGLGAVVGVAGLLGSLLLLLQGGRRGLGLSATARWSGVVTAVVAFEVVNALVTAPVEGSVHLVGAAAWRARLGCATAGTLFAALAGLLVFHGARRTAAVSPVTAGAVAGLAAGFVGVLAQHLHCPVMDLDHTLLAHVAPLAMGALLGAIGGRRWLAP